jgi:LuxR family transcriptional regulator
VAPLFWSYDQSEASDLHGNSDAAVSEFLLDHHRGRGVTVPIHTPYKGVATVTGVWDTHAARPPRPDQESLARFMFMAHELHRDLLATFDTQDLASKAVRLTPRERECIVLCAQGLSDKQVAAQLERSVSTVVMHMQSAFRKLGARNRAQAIARAAHYRLLD